jgi:hypothetical protein
MQYVYISSEGNKIYLLYIYECMGYKSHVRVNTRGAIPIRLDDNRIYLRFSISIYMYMHIGMCAYFTVSLIVNGHQSKTARARAIMAQRRYTYNNIYSVHDVVITRLDRSVEPFRTIIMFIGQTRTRKTIKLTDHVFRKYTLLVHSTCTARA